MTGEFEVANPHGLHARPAAALVRQARPADATVELRNVTTGSGWVPAASLSRVATLGALRGHRVEVRASGPGADRAVQGVLALAARRFDEPDRIRAAGPPPHALHDDPTRVPRHRPGRAPAADGSRSRRPVPGRTRAGHRPGRRAGRAPARPRRRPAPATRPRPDGAPRPRRATVRADLERTRELTRREVGEPEAAIFEAHLLLLDDPDLLADAERRIDAGTGPARAWLEAADRVAAEFEALPDPYLQARAADVRAVAGRDGPRAARRHRVGGRAVRARASWSPTT